jgi:hypothetical protein
MRMAGLDPGRAEDGHARADKMERAKSAQKIAHHLQQGEELFKTRARSFQENFIVGV